MRVLILLIGLAIGASATAAPGEVAARPVLLAAAEWAGPKGILPNQRAPKLDTQQAARRVKQTYSDHKILAVNLIDAKGPPVYRVKTLSSDGVVRYVYVDGTSGDVFE